MKIKSMDPKASLQDGFRRKMQQAKEIAGVWVDSLMLTDKPPELRVTHGDMESLYLRGTSFSDWLPYGRYLPEDQLFELEDGCSYAAAFDVYPPNVEGISPESIAAIRNSIMGIISGSINHDDNPYILQAYYNEETSLESFASTIRDYVSDRAKDSKLAAEYIPQVEQHLSNVCKKDGLFFDDTVTNTMWRGCIRVARVVLYRKNTLKLVSTSAERKALIENRERLENELHSAGLRFRRLNKDRFYDWMARWFNPKPRITDGDQDAYLRMFPCPAEDDESSSLSDILMITPPKVSDSRGVIEFDGVKHRAISVIGFRSKPMMGAFTAPHARPGAKQNVVNALVDQLPLGSTVCVTCVLLPPEETRRHFRDMADKAKGSDDAAAKVRAEAEEAVSEINSNSFYFPVDTTVFVRGDTDEELRANQLRCVALLAQAGLQAIDVDKDPRLIGTYIHSLPMNYDWRWAQDNSRFFYASTQYIANILPLMGRGRGSGLPGILGFNRGGEPVSVDPLDPDRRDREMSAHMLIFGPTGAGKSAFLVSTLLYYMAIYDPRIFCVEAGNSFGLLTEYVRRFGKTTFKARMTPGAGARVPPFANAPKALEAYEREQESLAEEIRVYEAQQKYSADLRKVLSGQDPVVPDPVRELELELEKNGFIQQATDEQTLQRDYLGEMEIIMRIMCAGALGDGNRVRLSHQKVFRDSILNAARTARDNGRKSVLTGDVLRELETIANDPVLNPELRRDLQDFAAAMSACCEGFPGQVFNRPGELWPDVDFTHVDLADFTKEGYEHYLAVVFLSIINQVNELAEKHQASGRDIIFLVDEAHNVTKHPLLAPAVTKIVKMWRKLRAWMWLGTQNMGDFPDHAKMMLSLCEFWMLLVVQPNELEQVARFKSLKKDEASLIKTCRKSKNFTEGALLGGKMKLTFFRFVATSLSLMLGASEGQEKKDRQDVMDRDKCSELDAALTLARALDAKRGFRSLF